MTNAKLQLRAQLCEENSFKQTTNQMTETRSVGMTFIYYKVETLEFEYFYPLELTANG